MRAKKNLKKMNYRKILSQPLSKIHISDLAAQIIIECPAEIADILTLTRDNEERIAWRSAWLLEKISGITIEFFGEKELLEFVEIATHSKFTGVQRSLLSILLNTGLPAKLAVEFINLCFERMLSPKSPVAVQVLSMRILQKLTKTEPDIITELHACLQNADDADYSVGWCSAKRQILKVL
jgi:hypothetical protein